MKESLIITKRMLTLKKHYIPYINGVIHTGNGGQGLLKLLVERLIGFIKWLKQNDTADQS